MSGKSGRLEACRRSVLRRITACVGLALAAAAPAWALDLGAQMQFDIPAQKLSAALLALAHQAKLQVVVAPDAGDREAPAVSGSASVGEALSRLLQGSGLVYRVVNDTTITIELPPAATAPAPRSEAQPAATPVTVVAAGDPAPPAESAQLQEIVVTATKREESARKIPATVNVLKGQDLEDIGARDMEDFLRYVPGVTLQEGATNNSRTISIRGVGPQQGANTTTGTLIDDVSIGDPYSSYVVADLDPFDLHDLEVLKGPQGTLFGASALNGALRYVLNKPALNDWEFKGFGDWLHVQNAGSGPTFGGAVNIPIGHTLALRAVDVVQEVPGEYSDINTNKDIKDADRGYKRMHRFLGLWQPVEEFSVNAFYLQQVGHRNDLSFANNSGGKFTRIDTPGPSTATEGFSVANLDVRYNFDFATLISETSRTTKSQNIDADQSDVLESLATKGIESIRSSGLVQSKEVSQELRLVSAPGDSPWVWIAGAYYSRYKATVSNNLYLANTQFLGQVLQDLSQILPSNLLSELVATPQGLSIVDVNFGPLKATEESLFGELTRKLWDERLQLNIGGRYYRETLFAYEQATGLFGPTDAIGGYDGDKSMTSKGFNPKASITLQATDDILWYANATHGFQFGGLNQPPAIPGEKYPLSYKPSTVWSYESGVRTNFFDNTLETDLTAFLLDWKNMQIQQHSPDGLTTYTDNVSVARSKGLEASVRYLTPIPKLVLINATSYIHAKVAELYTTASGVKVPVGSDLPAAPRLQTTTTLAYNTSLGPLRTGAGVSYTHQDHAFSDITHDAIIYRYNTLDFNFDLGVPNLPLSPEFTLNLSNALDAHAITGETVSSVEGLPSSYQTIYLRPRAVALRVSAHF
jgi:iron complex outermembrane recepter protein